MAKGEKGALGKAAINVKDGREASVKCAERSCPGPGLSLSLWVWTRWSRVTSRCTFEDVLAWGRMAHERERSAIFNLVVTCQVGPGI